MATLLRGDLDRGYLLIHQAVQEDIDTSQQLTPDTPGYWLVSLNYNKVDQAFRQWVIRQAEFLGTLLDGYNATHSRSLALGDLKRRFLDAPPRLETVFLLTYTLARLQNLGLAPKQTTMNVFAGQLEVNLLFDVALVIDSAISAKNPGQSKFIYHAEYLLNMAGRALTIAQLREINSAFRNNFNATLEAALERTLGLNDGTLLDRLQSDVAVAYGIRNHAAHNVNSAPTIWTRFPEMQKAVFRVLFLVIDYLYT